MRARLKAMEQRGAGDAFEEFADPRLKALEGERRKAADEIERLRTENDRIKSVALSEGDRMIAEIERLRAHIRRQAEDMTVLGRALIASNDHLRDEVDRLRMALQEIHDMEREDGWTKRRACRALAGEEKVG